MNGRRLPSGVWNVSLQGPITSGSVKANRPSEPRTTAINVRELGELLSSGGRYADVVVSESASPNAPSPRIHDRPRCLLRKRDDLRRDARHHASSSIGYAVVHAARRTAGRRFDAVLCLVRSRAGSCSGSARESFGIEPPEGDPMRATTYGVARRAQRRQGVGRLRPRSPTPDWSSRAGCIARADVVLEGFRPGVAERLGVGPDDARRRGATARSPASASAAGRAAARPRPRLPRLGRRARGHGAGGTARAGRGSCGRSARCGREILAALLEGGGAGDITIR